MDWSAPAVPQSLEGTARVPASKSMEQRARVLDALCEQPLELCGARDLLAGSDVRCLRAALAQLGHWHAGALGPGRHSLRLDAGEGATGFRFLLALAALRPEGARTLITGSPGLRKRSHRHVAAALGGLGVSLKRRHSGAWRVHGGGVRAPEVLRVDARNSSHAVTALALMGWRLREGLNLRVLGPVVSRPYLELTCAMLQELGLDAELQTAQGTDLWLRIPPGVPSARRLSLWPDASAAAAFLAAAVLAGGRVRVEGLLGGPAQADLALLGILERAGSEVRASSDGSVEVRRSKAQPLRALGDVDLHQAPDLIFLVGMLAALTPGRTSIRGTARTRDKESDRESVLLRALEAMGIACGVEAGCDGIWIQGGAPRAARLPAGGDHRAAFAFAALGLCVPGLTIAGAQCVVKSHPDFWEELRRLGRGA